jgi:catechol 2,3-dioxygenase-like lactoylglutathione lyase family enzyme
VSFAGVRFAFGTTDLDRTVAFYRDVLGLPVTGGFRDHDGFDGVFLALPGGAELELTHGGAAPVIGGEEELLVLYTDDLTPFRSLPTVPSGNPYWERWGLTVLDPDGRRVVLAVRSS